MRPKVPLRLALEYPVCASTGGTVMGLEPLEQPVRGRRDDAKARNTTRLFTISP